MKMANVPQAALARVRKSAGFRERITMTLLSEDDVGYPPGEYFNCSVRLPYNVQKGKINSAMAEYSYAGSKLQERPTYLYPVNQ